VIVPKVERFPDGEIRPCVDRSRVGIARQDRRRRAGEAVGARVMADAVAMAGAHDAEPLDHLLMRT
jgi:hypothetical protein